MSQAVPDRPHPPGSAAALDRIRRLVHTTAAIVLDDGKDYLLRSRLGPLLTREGLPSLDALADRVGRPDGASLRQRVIEAMTTNETSFFRDIHPFEAVRHVVLPALAAAVDRASPLTIWSAAASTGQELYSLGMLVTEQASRFAGRAMKLLGTDISTEVLARARAGRYTQLEVNRGLPAAQLVRHFDRVGTDWVVKPALRSLCEFRAMNLVDPWPPLPTVDLLFMRNVLIYFDEATRRRVLDRVVRVLRPGGFLFLGGVESTMHLSSRFTPITVDRTICYRLSEGGV